MMPNPDFQIDQLDDGRWRLSKLLVTDLGNAIFGPLIGFAAVGIFDTRADAVAAMNAPQPLPDAHRSLADWLTRK